MMNTSSSTIFSDFLRALEVPHTAGYSDRRFRDMPFKSLFGFSRLLTAYGIDNCGMRFTDKSRLTEIPTPFIAQRTCGFVIVTDTTDRGVDYLYNHKPGHMSLDDFTSQWTGVALLAYPDTGSREPDYARHCFFSIASRVKLWLLIACSLILAVAGVIYGDLYRHLSTMLLLTVNLAGIGVTWLLILKSLKVSNRSADKICGILQEHGCDTVLEQKASKFFGLFGWSEVGITYFSISTIILLIYPQHIGQLALINGCCLPFTVWSIWYQRFRIHTWCTLCVTTQCLLWLQFFCYLLGGHWHGALQFTPALWIMGAAYIATLMAVNRVMTFIEQRIQPGNNTQ